MLTISFRKYLVFIFVPLFAVATLLYQVASSHVDQFYVHETELAVTSINSTNSLIQQYLYGLRQNVGHFAKNYQDSLQQLVDHPNDKVLYKKVRDSVEMYFPGAATFTIADSQGNVLLKDVDTLIGKGCRENIRLFAISSQQSDAKLRIHSDRLNYHFDIMHEMHTNNGRVMIFFVSFEPGDIANYISSLQLPGHQLMILKKNTDALIEVTKEGVGGRLDRDKQLAPVELERILAVKDVNNTLWQLVDILDESRISHAKTIVFRDFGIIFGSFVLGTLLAFVTIMKHEKLRFHAESKLAKKSC